MLVVPGGAVVEAVVGRPAAGEAGVWVDAGFIEVRWVGDGHFEDAEGPVDGKCSTGGLLVGVGGVAAGVVAAAAATATAAVRAGASATGAASAGEVGLGGEGVEEFGA